MYFAMERAKASDVLVARKRKEVEEDKREMADLLLGMFGGPAYIVDLDPRKASASTKGSEGPSGLRQSEPGFLAVDLGNPVFKIALEIVTQDQIISQVQAGDEEGEDEDEAEADVETESGDPMDGLTAAKIRLLNYLDWTT